MHILIIKKLNRLSLLVLFILLGINGLMAQPEPIQDGLSISAPVSNYIIPDGISAMTISARGADGGDARRNGNCDKRGKGGAGATVAATFEAAISGLPAMLGWIVRWNSAYPAKPASAPVVLSSNAQ